MRCHGLPEGDCPLPIIQIEATCLACDDGFAVNVRVYSSFTEATTGQRIRWKLSLEREHELAFTYTSIEAVNAACLRGLNICKDGDDTERVTDKRLRRRWIYTERDIDPDSLVFGREEEMLSSIFIHNNPVDRSAIEELVCGPQNILCKVCFPPARQTNFHVSHAL